ncbi:helix-turn-helix transcriptional regulator [Selenomonas sp. TAMA-11512]|uniref:helix-turn-helix domain-containing protein n=1 Tax=Selenomonas sp. TAMA-11512 TaxID=3095337 RepID=UPI0030D4EC31
MRPPYQTPSAELLAKIRRYIAEHLRDAADAIEATVHEMPHRMPSPREEERKRYSIIQREPPRKPELLDGISGALDSVFSRLKEKLQTTDETFSERLLRLIDERGMTDAEVYKRAGIDRKHFSKIRTDKTYQPKAKVVYAFIFALRLNLDEAKDLLASAGYTISPAREYDLVMEFCIMEGCGIDTVNGILYELGMDVLCGKVG